jgi:capsular polysaccharide biosynthesis protein
MAINYLEHLKKGRRQIIFVTVFLTLLFVGVSFIEPMQYSATVQLLVIEKVSPVVDPYTALKSAERIGANLASLIKTSTFFDKILHAGYNIDLSYFKSDENQKRKQWEKMVDAQTVPGTGFLSITVYHENRDQADQISQAIAYTLATKARDYVGSEIDVKVVDLPLISKFPVRPNLILRFFAGIFLGLILSGTLIIYRVRRKPEEMAHHTKPQY